jgi:hypothetical protein
MKHIVMFSGGLGSWATAKRVAERHGTSDLTLLFADVKGDNPSPHAGEDEDTYRFLREAAADVGGELVWLNEGRDIWQVFHDNRFLGNSRLANCSKFLKQKPCREWLDVNCDPSDTALYVGIDWTETHRVPGNRLGYAHTFERPCVDVRGCLAYINGVDGAKPCKRHLGDKAWRVEFPMTEEPYLDKDAVEKMCVDAGIKIPRLYRAGFAHNNCGGFCVRAGQAQFELLLREHPDRYAYHEAKEEELRGYLDADVSVLRDRAGGASTPLTMREFRERIESQPAMFDALDFGGCGCFTDDYSEGKS